MHSLTNPQSPGSPYNPLTPEPHPKRVSSFSGIVQVCRSDSGRDYDYAASRQRERERERHTGVGAGLFFFFLFSSKGVLGARDPISITESLPPLRHFDTHFFVKCLCRPLTGLPSFSLTCTLGPSFHPCVPPHAAPLGAEDQDQASERDSR